MNDDRAQAATKGDLLGLESIVKGDIQNLESIVKGDIQNLRSEVKGDLLRLEDKLVEAIRDSQTEVLKAFYGFSQTVQDRFKEQDQAEASIKRRMGTLESRILEIEKRLNMPPSAA